jgi:nucleoside 2-deoxyribosyltransferase
MRPAASSARDIGASLFNEKWVRVLEQMVEHCFKPAVKRAGFELKKLTDEQPAGLIDDQIRASILSARFVIADLTHGSHGAYWEAGFAEGLNLPVIYTCEKTLWEERKTHFDTNHMLTIIWDPAKPKETGDALTATVRATLRAEARQQDWSRLCSDN